MFSSCKSELRNLIKKKSSAQCGAEFLETLFDYRKNIVAQHNIKWGFELGPFNECCVLLAWVGERNRLVQSLD